MRALHLARVDPCGHENARLPLREPAIFLVRGQFVVLRSYSQKLDSAAFHRAGQQFSLEVDRGMRRVLLLIEVEEILAVGVREGIGQGKVDGLVGGKPMLKSQVERLLRVGLFYLAVAAYLVF